MGGSRLTCSGCSTRSIDGTTGGCSPQGVGECRPQVAVGRALWEVCRQQNMTGECRSTLQ